MEIAEEIHLKFVPPKSFVHHDFWYKLADIKLNIDKLQDSPKEVIAAQNCDEHSKVLIELDYTAFNSQTTLAENTKRKGVLLNTNTIEEFKSKDKNVLIKRLSDDYFNKLLSKETIESSADLFFFLIFSFADFKTHKYYYWFAFPAFRDAIYKCTSKGKSIVEYFSENQLKRFETKLQTFSNKFSEPVFIFDSKSDCIYKLSDFIQHNNINQNLQNVDLESLYFCCDDRSVDENPCWLLRQLLGYLLFTCPSLENKEIRCICLRQTLLDSIVLFLKMPTKEIDPDKVLWTGWEANKYGKLVPQLADMSKVMDSELLAKQSITLNLTLMKWRLVPDLNIEIINQSKFLLLGAGTLGCVVARSLLAWGAQHITFVDCGKVSLSNPVRQCLYLYEDAKDGGQPKALTAAMRLKQIHPCVVSFGHSLAIPMPGHSVGESQYAQIKEAIDNLENLIKEHDVIFLLTDSRESRWLPTMLATYYGKMTINAALGFDSFLVMRHGTQSTSCMQQSKTVEGFKEVPGSRLGCYFCNDIVAPGNSLKDRTLDQQCTVTRPAVANIAASLAVELTVSLLQHAARDGASAYYKTSNTPHNLGDIPEEILGIVPHSIRGNISAFNYLITATERFSECIACSKPILDRFKEQGKSFIIEALNSTNVLEDTAGISNLTSSVDEMLDFTGSDSE